MDTPTPADPVTQYESLSALFRLREQNTYLVSEYSQLKSQIKAVFTRLSIEDRRISRSGISVYPEQAGTSHSAHHKLLENARKQLEIYAKEYALLRRKVQERCTLDAVIAIEDSNQDLHTRLSHAKQANSSLRRQQRILDKAEKHSPDPWVEIEHYEREVEIYLRKVRDLQGIVQGNVDKMKEYRDRLEKIEKFVVKDEEKPKNESEIGIKSELESMKLQLNRLESDKNATENRLKSRISDLEVTLKSLLTQEDSLRSQNTAKDQVRRIQEAQLLRVKLEEIQNLREIREKRRERCITTRETASSTPLLRKKSRRILTPVP